MDGRTVPYNWDSQGLYATMNQVVDVVVEPMLRYTWLGSFLAWCMGLLVAFFVLRWLLRYL